MGVPHGSKVRFNRWHHCTIYVHSNGIPQGVPGHPLLLSRCLAAMGFEDTFHYVQRTIRIRVELFAE